MQDSAKGFTLIELIVVIVILGILASTALPKVIDLKKEAGQASFSGVIGAASSAMSMNYAGCVITNHIPVASKCVMVSNCTDVTKLLTSDWPTNMVISPGSLAGNGKSMNCTVKNSETGTSLNFAALGAGQSGKTATASR